MVWSRLMSERLIRCSVILLLAFGTSLARAQTATLILLNGKIWTENPSLPESQAIAIAGERILAVGSSATIRKLASVQLGDANSEDELRRRLAEYAKSLARGTWIREGNWDHERWTPAALPTHQLIDDVTPDNPVMVWRVDGHMVLVNAYAMRLAGIDRTTQDLCRRGNWMRR